MMKAQPAGSIGRRCPACQCKPGCRVCVAGCCRRISRAGVMVCGCRALNSARTTVKGTATVVYGRWRCMVLPHRRGYEYAYPVASGCSDSAYRGAVVVGQPVVVAVAARYAFARVALGGGGFCAWLALADPSGPGFLSRPPH